MAGRTLLAEGREAEVFLLDDGTVLKLLRRPEWEHRVGREVAALQALAGAGLGLRVPRVVGRMTDGDGRPGLLLSRVEGASLLDRLARQPLGVDGAARAMATAHAGMHGCVAPGGLPPLRDILRERIADAEPLTPAQRRAATARLDALPDGDRLCHNDLHLGNILGSYGEPVVIDWGDASRGEPVADVARTVLLHRVGALPPGTAVAMRAFARVGRGLLVARYLTHYRRLRPFDTAAADAWTVVHAAARLAEPVPEEHPKLHRIVRSRLG